MTSHIDFELKPKFNVSYQSFWQQNQIKVKYPQVWDRVKVFFIAFTSSHLLERALSVATALLDNKRIRLDMVR